MRCDVMMRQKRIGWDEMCKIAIKATYYFVNILLVFQKVFLVSNATIQAWNSVYPKKIDFLKIGWLNLHQNAWNQRKVKNCNESKILFQWIPASLSEILCDLQWLYSSFQQCLLKKPWSS